MASLNNSHNNDNTNYANGLNISPNTHVQIDRSIFASYWMHKTNLKQSMGIFTGHRLTEVTKSLVMRGKREEGRVTLE